MKSEEVLGEANIYLTGVHILLALLRQLFVQFHGHFVKMDHQSSNLWVLYVFTIFFF